MSLVAEFRVPPEDLPFAEALATNPDARIEVERIVPTDERAFPFFWVWDSRPRAFIEAANAESEIEGMTVLEQVDGGMLIRARWSPGAELVDAMRRLQGTILSSEGTADGWCFEVRAQDREAFLEFADLFGRRGITIELERLADYGDFVDRTEPTLTEAQRAALVAAYEEGYFDNPREVEQAELGERFDISHRAVAERIRRGTKTLIEEAVIDDAT